MICAVYQASDDGLDRQSPDSTIPPRNYDLESPRPPPVDSCQALLSIRQSRMVPAVQKEMLS